MVTDMATATTTTQKSENGNFPFSPFTSNIVWLFSKKTTIAASGILSGATDHHSHILPGVDDGVETIDEALRILATYEELGIKALWLTPHIMEDCPNSPQKLRARFEKLKAAYNGSVELHLAAEYMIDNHLRKLLNKLRHSLEGRWHEQSVVTEGSKSTEPLGAKGSPSLLRGASDTVAEGQREVALLATTEPLGLQRSANKPIEEANNSPSFEKREYPKGEGDENNKLRPAAEGRWHEQSEVTEGSNNLLPIGTSGKHILVETSYYNAPMKMRDTLQQIKSLSYHPLLAHPERYMYLNNAEYTRLHSEGVRFQLNLASLAGGYGKVVKKKALWLLANGLYSVAGSDLHCEDTIEFITKCKLGMPEIELVKQLLTNRL